jgi:lipid-binding SYLF domain-containing protein
MKNRFARASALLTVTVLSGAALPAQERQPTPEVTEALAVFVERDSTLKDALQRVPGYAVFPRVIKGGVGVGGARGGGELVERGTPVGSTTLTQVTVGFQLGGQSYSELILFESERSLQAFKQGNFEFSAQLSAVAAAEGASANAKFEQGVKVITFARGGLMYEAAVGGQKFGFSAY